MSSLEAQLGFDASDPALERAIRNAEENFNLIAELVKARKDKGLKQSEVGAMLGISQATVASFERSSNDPKLSTIRKYANAIGVVVTHEVIAVDLPSAAETAEVESAAPSTAPSVTDQRSNLSSWLELHAQSAAVNYLPSDIHFMDWAATSAYEQTQADFVVAS